MAQNNYYLSIIKDTKSIVIYPLTPNLFIYSPTEFDISFKDRSDMLV